MGSLKHLWLVLLILVFLLNCSHLEHFEYTVCFMMEAQLMEQKSLNHEEKKRSQHVTDLQKKNFKLRWKILQYAYSLKKKERKKNQHN